MTNSRSDEQTALPLGDMVSVRQRLIVSLSLALAFTLAWGPFCAFTHLLRTKPPTIFFSPSRYLFLMTAMCLVAGVVVLVAAIPLIALTVCAWKRLGSKIRRWSLSIGLIALAMLAARYMDVLFPDLFASRPATVASHILYKAQWGIVILLVWSIMSAYFNLPGIQIGAFPLASVYALFTLADLLEPLVVVSVSVILLYVCQRYIKANMTKDLIIDALGMTAFVTVAFAAALYIRVGHFVFALDIPYLLGFLGVSGLVLGLLLMTQKLL